MIKIYTFLAYFLLILPVSAQQRIITAGSSSSEIVCALGSCENIVATDRTSLYPASLQSLPSIGYRAEIGAEGIIAQAPDLVIFEEDYVKEELIIQLKSTGIKTLIVRQEGNLENTFSRIRQIAEAIGKVAEGEKLISAISEKMEQVNAMVSATDSRPKVLCVYNRGAGNMMVAGKMTSFSLLENAGVENAIPDVEGYKPLNTEALIKANPDYILFFESGLQSIGGVEGALKIPGVSQTSAGKKRQIIAMDGIFLTNWGPRVADAAMELFTLTHPKASN